MPSSNDKFLSRSLCVTKTTTSWVCSLVSSLCGYGWEERMAMNGGRKVVVVLMRGECVEWKYKMIVIVKAK